MTSHAIWVDKITGVIISIGKVNKNLNILKKNFLFNRFCTIYKTKELKVKIPERNNYSWSGIKNES